MRGGGWRVAELGSIFVIVDTTLDRDTIYHTNPNYVTTKLYEMSACGCSNNTVIHKGLFSRFLRSTYAGHVGLAAAEPW